MTRLERVGAVTTSCALFALMLAVWLWVTS